MEFGNKGGQTLSHSTWIYENNFGLNNEVPTMEPEIFHLTVSNM